MSWLQHWLGDLTCPCLCTADHFFWTWHLSPRPLSLARQARSHLSCARSQVSPGSGRPISWSQFSGLSFSQFLNVKNAAYLPRFGIHSSLHTEHAFLRHKVSEVSFPFCLNRITETDFLWLQLYISRQVCHKGCRRRPCRMGRGAGGHRSCRGRRGGG